MNRKLYTEILILDGIKFKLDGCASEVVYFSYNCLFCADATLHRAAVSLAVTLPQYGGGGTPLCLPNQLTIVTLLLSTLNTGLNRKQYGIYTINIKLSEDKFYPTEYLNIQVSRKCLFVSSPIEIFFYLVNIYRSVATEN